MDGLTYSASFENVTLTDASQDIILIATGSIVPATIKEILLNSDVTTDIRARLQLLFRSTAGSSGSSVTPRATDGHNSRAAAASVTIMRTTPGTAGNVVDGDRWSLLTKFQRLWTPEDRIRVPAAGFLALFLAAGTGGARNLSGKIVFAE